MEKQNHQIFNIFKTMFALMLIAFTIVSCKSDDDDEIVELAKPKISNIEIGLNNNEIGVIAKDFHFNAEVVAGDRIDYVQAEILPKAGETYSKPWQHKIVWEQNRGAKNSVEHHHFDVPADAAEGTYDFIITVKDLNGTETVEKRKITLYTAENLPVNPDLYAMNILVNGSTYYTTYQGLEMPNYKFKNGDVFSGPTRLSGVKADGKMYLVLINKKFNHKPETVNAIDFSKTIVYSLTEHQNIANTTEITNLTASELTIGATVDGIGNPITGQKAWENGTYYYGVVYTNSTYNMSYFNYIEIPVEL